MARITSVKKAQQRYATVPVLNEDGTPKRTPVMGRNGEQKVTKHGRPVFMSVTGQDRSKPLAPYTCDSCGEAIKVGTPYKHVTPKSGPYGGTQRNRHQSCPTWQVWELSNSWSARIEQATHGFDVSDVDNADDVVSALADVAEAIRELAEESRESAQNIEEGFGHPTSQSEEAEERADNLDSWADEIEGADVPEYPEPEEVECTACEGSGVDENDADLVCSKCDGNKVIVPDEPTEEQIDQWFAEVDDAVSIVNECPI